MLVMKFGGTSVADAARIDEVARLIAAADEPVAAVVSAMSGVTDTLLQLGRAAASGHEVQATLAALRARHQSCPVDAIGAAALARDLDELDRLLQGVALLRELTPRSIALLASFGERLSASIAASSLRALGRRAVPAVVARRTPLARGEPRLVHGSRRLATGATRLRRRSDTRPFGAVASPPRGWAMTVVVGHPLESIAPDAAVPRRQPFGGGRSSSPPSRC